MIVSLNYTGGNKLVIIEQKKITLQLTATFVDSVHSLFVSLFLFLCPLQLSQLSSFDADDYYVSYVFVTTFDTFF